MSQRLSRVNRLFGRSPSDIPEWMTIRDADNKRRNDNQDKLRAARLARDASQAAEAANCASGSSRSKRVRKKKTKP